MREKKKKKKGRGVKGGICLVAIAAVLLGFLGFDIGGFGGQIGFPTFAPDEPQTQAEVQAEAPPQEPETGERPLSLLISVSGDTILHDDNTITIGQLRNLLQERNQPEYVWELRDEQAVLAAYEEVRMLLLEHDVTFTETAR